VVVAVMLKAADAYYLFIFLGDDKHTPFVSFISIRGEGITPLNPGNGCKDIEMGG
jgi:hypothetical protein